MFRIYFGFFVTPEDNQVFDYVITVDIINGNTFLSFYFSLFLSIKTTLCRTIFNTFVPNVVIVPISLRNYNKIP